MDAIISDIHSNIEALSAVFDDMAAFNVTRVLCLGDVIGYGPNPCETLDMVSKSVFVLLGNHEEGLLESADGFNDRARRALEWTRDELNSTRVAQEKRHEYWNFLGRFERQKEEDGKMYVHASPRQPVREYVMPADALDRTKMADIFEHMGAAHVCFGGHTHVPGLFSSRGFRHQSEFKDVVPFPQDKCMVNIGSVGQPRDGDNRACYVLVDGDSFRFRRVTYDFATTMKKIMANPKLDDFLARRLKVGQ